MLYISFIYQPFVHVFHAYLNTSHPNMSFSFKQAINGKLSFLGVEVSRQQGNFVTTVYGRSTFSGVYTHFDNFLPTVYKVGMTYTLAYRCFKIFSDWTKFNEELNFPKHVFLRNVYSLSLLTNVLKLLLISWS